MTNDKGIFIKNIYYMLSYAFQVLRQKNYEKVESEEFEDIQDLFAAILANGIAKQLKQGLHREYITQHEDLPVLRGKLDIRQTVKIQMQKKKLLSCEYDELSVNNIFNQILKTTVMGLLQDAKVKKERKISLKKIMPFFDEVDSLDPFAIQWSRLQYQRNNKNYEMLMNLCYFVLDGMLQTTDSGTYKMVMFSDEHMHRLFERFVLEYYKKHHSYLNDVRAAQVRWNLDEDSDRSMIQFLPEMKTDIFLRKQDKILIIDTKYYGKIMQSQYDKATLRSAHMYQIFAYVKNQDTENSGNVAGLLLYAKTDEDITPDCSFMMGGNKIGAKTLDLNRDFGEIKEQLDAIVEEYL